MAVDADLVKRFNAGDVEAFAELYRRYFGLIRSYHFVLLRQTELAENLAQETFLRAFQAAPRLPVDHFKPWLFMIARHLAIDEARRRKRQRTVSLESVARVLPSGEASDPAAGALRGEARRRTATILAELPRHYQELLLLRDLFGLSYDEIGQAMGLSREAVKSALHRARLDFRRRYAESEGR
ncbi:MAG TPA: RNA polymerase sigma factor [Firmicutes bacterium]|nr:RNA polymerase sigma factor [Bacillota bacterium]